MSKSNVTIKVDDALLREVRVIAAKKDSSISALLSDYIENIVRDDKAYSEARDRAKARMKEGWDLGWKPGSREELHDR